ncbi:MAG: 16S rRNA (guanine(966)-N(2))-methyltransferase RsmD [Chlamydiales bacterium]
MIRIIGGKYKGIRLLSPRGNETRPSLGKLRESFFNICQNSIVGARFLDLFAGAGAMGLEALSRGANHVTFVENAREALQTIKKNVSLLREESRVTILSLDVTVALKKMEGPFDLIFADPPYGKYLGDSVITACDTLPLLADEGELFIEDTLYNDLSLQHLQLKSTRKIGLAILKQYSRLN